MATDICSELTTDSPRSVWSPSMTQLFAHQLAELHKMRALESSLDTTLVGSNSTSLSTKVGILCSKPGSGKSASILATIASNPNLFSPTYLPTRIYTSIGGVISLTTVDANVKLIPTNIVVTPRAILHQWMRYVDMFTDIPPQRVLAKAALHKDDTDRIFDGQFSLVLVSERAMRVIIDDDRYFRSYFSRVVLDEADSICIPTWSSFPRARFTWLVTASSSSLLVGNSRTIFVRDFFRNCSIGASRMSGALLVRSAPEFIETSVLIPTYSERTIRIRRSVTFKDIMPRNAIRALDADDVTGAIVAIGCQTVRDTDCLLAAVCRKIDDEIETLRCTIASAPVSSIPDLISRLRESEARKVMVIDRVRDTGICPITFETIDTKAVVPCCNNAFEMLAVMKSLQHSPVCPLCRSTLDPSSLVVQTATDVPMQSEEIMVNKRSALMRELCNILAQDDSRVLVYSSWDFMTIRRACVDADIEFVTIKGHTTSILKTLDQFRNGTVRVLFMDAIAYGAGLNLEFATHLILYHELSQEHTAQVLGRTQRPGRTRPLSVINLRYDSEA
jgi:SNF2-related domain